MDSETSLYLLGGGGDGRYYDPQTANFLSVDPAEDDVNPYRYVRNDPVNGIDPSGMEGDNDQSAKIRELTSLRLLNKLTPEQERRIKELQEEVRKLGPKAKPIPQTDNSKEDGMIGLLPPELRDQAIQYAKNSGLRPQNWKPDQALALEAQLKLAKEEVRKFVAGLKPKLEQFGKRSRFTPDEVKLWVDAGIAKYYEENKYAVVSLPAVNGGRWYAFLHFDEERVEVSRTIRPRGDRDYIDRKYETRQWYNVVLSFTSSPDVKVDESHYVELLRKKRLGELKASYLQCASEVVSFTWTLAAHLTPIANTAVTVLDEEKSEWDVVVAVVEDVTTIIGIGLVAKAFRGAKFVRALTVGSAGLKGIAGIVRIGQGANKLDSGDDVGGALLITEGLLQLIFAGAEVGLFKKLTKDVREAEKALAAGCFPVDTLVAAQSGPKAIQSILAGDLVWAYDFDKCQWVLRRVAKTYQHDYDGDLVSLTVDGETIEATSSHPFWVVAGERLEERELHKYEPSVETNTKLQERWVDAGNLRVGDALFLMKTNTTAAIDRLVIRHVHSTVYNIQVEDLHNFSVGASQILVHNKPVTNTLPLPKSETLGIWGKVKIPNGYQVGELTPQQIASKLPVWTEGEAAHGALVVDGKVYLLKTNPTGKASYASGVVPEELVGEVGFTAQNFNHIESQSAAILRRLQAEGADVSGAYVVVNRPFICVQGGQGCAPNLPKMLPKDVKLKVYPTTETSGKIAQPRVQTFEGE